MISFSTEFQEDLFQILNFVQKTHRNVLAGGALGAARRSRLREVGAAERDAEGDWSPARERNDPKSRLAIPNFSFFCQGWHSSFIFPVFWGGASKKGGQF